MFTILGPDGPVTLILNGDQYIVGIAGQNLTAGGSPTYVELDPPLGPITSINLGELYQELMTLLRS